MASDTTPVSKGERSRRRILEAALSVIASEGLRGATHRAIAKAADVPLSLTTYFFSSRDDLLLQAFDLLAERVLARTAERFLAMRAAIESLGAAQLADPAVRRQLHALFTDRLLQLVLEDDAEHMAINAVEASYMFAPQSDPALRARVEAFRATLVAGIAELMAPLGIADPHTDASLVLGMVHRLEYGMLGRSAPVDPAPVRREIERLLALVLGV